jgi:hypothetical protein
MLNQQVDGFVRFRHALTDRKAETSLTFQVEWEGRKYKDKGHILSSGENQLL